LNNWQAAFASRNNTVVKLNFSEIKDRMLRRLEEAYIKMFDVVQGDRVARKTRQEAGYFDKLNKAWKPIASAQMEQAAVDLATILNSAYEEAGRPTLDPGPKIRVNPKLLED
jgi:hypothetical protein